MLRQFWEDLPLNHFTTQHSMLIQVLHDHQRHVSRGVIDFGDVLRAILGVVFQCLNLKVHASP